MRVFISHSSKDKKFVRLLKDSLLENSIETWFDEDQLDLGDKLVNKLENALDDSSHLVIILSPSSINSDWVNFELKRAIKNNRTGLNSKIIPIKYKECNVPDEISDLLHADLTDEVVLPDNDRVKFISSGFDSFFLKLVRTIRNSAKTITKAEKEEILKSIKASKQAVDKHQKSIHRGNYKLIGYTTLESRKKFQNKLKGRVDKVESIEDIKPLLLPYSLKTVYKPELGIKLMVEGDELPFGTEAHFAGYRNDDLAIAVDKRTRDGIMIDFDNYYQIEIDPEKDLIRFVNKIKTNANTV
ncbi:toll/interleukin-1 receptor domain-containing protein [Maribacter forsetii]|uniref:toll/interleukin-1 receptor domain-containing protein n=1 Tax=Maribacter forsetii TaxID=444515 RepID=UPI0005691D93|nr:toll/interleukin-1 receptor domain-containing protein [Maribacter forsetii]